MTVWTAMATGIEIRIMVRKTPRPGILPFHSENSP